MSRAQQIQNQLVEHFAQFAEVGLSTRVLSPDGWGDQAPLGWAWPALYDGVLEIRLCPQIIDAQTADLTDDDHAKYLDIVEWVCDSHLFYARTEPDPAKRQLIIEDELYELFPDSLQLWFDRRVAVIDERG